MHTSTLLLIFPLLFIGCDATTLERNTNSSYPSTTSPPPTSETESTYGSNTNPCNSYDNTCHSIKVSWSASPDTKVIGYYVYHRTTSGVYNDKYWIESATELTIYTDRSGDHYFSVTAISPSGESPKSAESMVTL